MTPFLRTRLSAMMFLYYFALGAWAVTSATYLKSPPAAGGLGFTNAQVGWVYSTFALGGLMAMPLIGLLVDRLFRADRVFSVVSLLCGVFLCTAWWWCERNEPVLAAAAAAGDPAQLAEATAGVFRPLFAIMLVYSFCLQIGLPLCTVLALRNLSDPQHQFSRVRLWGTVGWIAAGLSLAVLLNPVSAQPFLLSGVVAVAAGLYGLTLPATRPKGGGKSLAESFGLPALKLFREQSFVVFVVVALVLSVMNQFYGVHGHRFLTERWLPHPERWMVLGQVVEVTCMFLIPVLNPKRNMKWLMLAGAAAGSVRGAVLAWSPDWLLLAAGVPLHGVHFAFYFILAATFIDREAPPHLRASAQAIVAFLVSGVGPLVGNTLAAGVLDSGRVDGQTDWESFWLWPLVVCGVATVGFLAWFRTPTAPPLVIHPVVPSSQLTRQATEPEPATLGG